MAPPGLLPKLRCMLQHEFAWMDRCSGATVGVDAFKLLHEAVRNHCDQCVLSGNYSGALGYIIQKMDTMRCNGIRPLMVFDGRDLDGKAVAGRKRRKDRLQAQDAVAVALSDQDADALADGTLTVQVDPKTLQAAAAVTTGFIGLCVEACREMGISYVVAPNEADAQLAYLARTGQVQYVITDDGDLCVYGCPRVLLKVDFSTGKCDLFEASRLLISTPGTPIGSLFSFSSATILAFAASRSAFTAACAWVRLSTWRCSTAFCWALIDASARNARIN